MSKIGRNDPCHCGSGRKYKQCCIAKDEAAEREARAKAEAAAPAAEPEDAGDATDARSRNNPGHTHPQGSRQPWKRGSLNTHAFQKVSAPRKVGGGG